MLPCMKLLAVYGYSHVLGGFVDFDQQVGEARLAWPSGSTVTVAALSGAMRRLISIDECSRPDQRQLEGATFVSPIGKLKFVSL